MSFGRRQGVVKGRKLHAGDSRGRRPPQTDITSRFNSGTRASARLTSQTLAALSFLVVFANWFSSDAMSATRNALSVSSIYEDAARESIGQHRVAKRRGDKVEACLMAARAAIAFRKAKDEYRSRVWRATAGEDCAASGLPGLLKAT